MITADAPTATRTPVLLYPAPELRTPGMRVTEFDEGLSVLVATLERVRLVTRALGVAAQQIGVAARVFVYRDNEGKSRCFVNPKVVERSGEVLSDEGCLSFRGLVVQVPRSERITVTGHNIEGKQVTAEAEGLEAMILQHELDHLDGVLLIDRVATRQARRRLERAVGVTGNPAGNPGNRKGRR